MFVTIRWESLRWWCYVQQTDGRRSRVESPAEFGMTDGQRLEDWAKCQWPGARVQFDEYEF